MGITSIQRNVAASSSNSLVGQYLKVADRDKSGASSGVVASPFRLVTADDLKGQLLNLASRLKNFADADFRFGSRLVTSNPVQDVNNNDGSGSGEGSGGNGSSTPVSNEVNVGASSGGSSGTQFARQVFRDFQKGVKDPSDRILSNKNLSGDVEFNIGSGDSALSFSISVDGNTTAQQFVDQFNSKAQGRAQASLVESADSSGESRYRIKIQSAPTPQLPPPPPSEEGETGEEGSLPGSGVLPPAVDASTGSSGLLGSGRLNLADLQPEAARVAQGLKEFVRAFNSLVSFTEEGNRDGNVLSTTGVDETALSAVRDAIETASSNDKSVQFGSFIYSRGDKLVFDEQDFDQSFLENPEAVGEAIRDLASVVGGRDGVVRSFVATGSKIDQAFASLEVQTAQAAVSGVNDRSLQQLQEAQLLNAQATTSVSALQDKSAFLSAFRK